MPAHYPKEFDREPNLSIHAAVDRIDTDSRRAPMQPTARSRQIRRLTGLAAVALVGVLALSVAGGIGRTAPTKRVVKVEALSDGSSVLANLRGRTLYSLSVEEHGKFICTAGCLSIWHPLIVAKGVKPTGPVSLGRVERPNGKTQVTYRGRPLYSFAEDTKAGEANGEGIKDVGTWHAAKPATSSSQPTEPEPVPTSPYPTTTPYPY
jgi:predicted lipoprotein with Yx(FWY)xxD motif